MIATQKNLDVGHIILDKETLGSKYDEYKKLHNVVVTNEGEEDEYLAFILRLMKMRQNYCLLKRKLQRWQILLMKRFPYRLSLLC